MKLHSGRLEMTTNTRHQKVSMGVTTNHTQHRTHYNGIQINNRPDSNNLYMVEHATTQVICNDYQQYNKACASM